MERCCVCLGECDPPIIVNSGITLCFQCVCELKYCPTTHIGIITYLPNKFAAGFFQYLLSLPLPLLVVQPPFSIEKLLESSDKIAYMNQYDEIELYDPEDLFDYDYNMFLLNIDEYKVFASKCINLDEHNDIIHYACWGNNLDIVKYLVEERNVDINYIDRDGWYPIHSACNSLDLIEYLVEKGADINCRGYKGNHLIHLVCNDKYDESIEIAEWLIAHNVDVNCLNDELVSPIHYACMRGMLGIVKLLVGCGLDVNCADKNGWCPIHYACENGNIELVKYLISCGVKLNSFTKCGTHPLHIAIRRVSYGESKLFQLLEKNGANLNCADDE